MKSESAEHRTSRTRSVCKRLGVGLVVIAVSLFAFYAATPFLVARLGPYVAERLGLKHLDMTIGYPDLSGVDIDRLALTSDDFALSAENARIDYSWPELRKGAIDSLAFESVEISLFSRTKSPVTSASTIGKPIFPTLPFRVLSARRLVLSFPDTGFVGIGRARLGDGVLSFSMDGLEPETASHFSLTATLSRDGVFSARFGERDNRSVDFVALQGTLSSDTVSVAGNFTLTGYALQLVSALAGLPTGTGTVGGEIRTHLPWPLPDNLTWQEMSATLPSLTIDWKSAASDFELNAITGAVDLERGSVRASLSGGLRYGMVGRDLSAELPPGYELNYSDGRLNGGAGLRVRLKASDTDAEIALRSFSWGTALPSTLEVDADIDARLSSVRTAGRLKGQLTLDESALPRAHGRLDFFGSVRTADQQHRGMVNGAFAIAGNDLRVDGNITSGLLKKVPFALNYNLDSDGGRLDSATTFDFGTPVAAAVFTDWAKDYDLDAGQVHATAKLRWRTLDSVSADVVLTLTDGEAHYQSDTASGISGRLNFRSNNIANEAGWKLDPAVLRFERVEAGLSIDELVIGLTWSGDRVDVANASANLLGGRAISTPFSYQIRRGDAAFDLALEGIDLATLLALEGDDIAGTGTLSGTLPVVVTDDRIRISGGVVTSGPSGGTIRTSTEFSGPTGQPGLDFALLALTDFNYSELSAEVDYAENGDLGLAVHLLGYNPAVEDGRPIRYNLNINENIPVLLESLRLQDRVTERIESEVKK